MAITPATEKPITGTIWFFPEAVPLGRGQVGQPRSARPIGQVKSMVCLEKNVYIFIYIYIYV